jgi:hypothetical protein
VGAGTSKVYMIQVSRETAILSLCSIRAWWLTWSDTDEEWSRDRIHIFHRRQIKVLSLLFMVEAVLLYSDLTPH